LLQALTVSLDRDPTREEAHTAIPDLLIDAYYTSLPIGDDNELVRVGQPSILRLLQCFIPTLTEEQVNAWEYDDFSAAWEALWQQCRIPFELGYTTMMQGRFQLARELYRGMNQTSSMPSSEPDLTPETATSNVNMSLPSLTPNRATRRATSRSKGTGQALATQAPTVGNGMISKKPRTAQKQTSQNKADSR
jgi:hypothetical protein